MNSLAVSLLSFWLFVSYAATTDISNDAGDSGKVNAGDDIIDDIDGLLSDRARRCRYKNNFYNVGQVVFMDVMPPGCFKLVCTAKGIKRFNIKCTGCLYKNKAYKNGQTISLDKTFPPPCKRTFCRNGKVASVNIKCVGGVGPVIEDEYKICPILKALGFCDITYGMIQKCKKSCSNYPIPPTSNPSNLNYTGCGIVRGGQGGGQGGGPPGGGPTEIVGGGPADVNEWPMMVFLTMGGAMCGGTIITDQWVLTAKHCVDNERNLTVYGGVHKLSEINTNKDVQIRGVTTKVLHPGPDYDVALLKLDKKFDINTKVNTACLPNYDYSYAGLNGTATGWGLTSHKGNISDVLKDVTYPILSNTECEEFQFDVEDYYLCAAHEAKGTCGGDSGGPLFVEGGDGRWSIVGANSFSGSNNCINPDYFVRITSVMPWIKANCK